MHEFYLNTALDIDRLGKFLRYTNIGGKLDLEKRQSIKLPTLSHFESDHEVYCTPRRPLNYDFASIKSGTKEGKKLSKFDQLVGWGE